MIFAAVARAQTPPAFANFRCVCQPGSPLQQPTPSLFGAPSVGFWRGSVYALTDVDAELKAKSACVAEQRTTPSLCDSCRCSR
jgi:hypothetical protein